MILSKNFLKDYVDIDENIDIKTLAEDLTRVGNEYDLYILKKMDDIFHRIGKIHLGRLGMFNYKFLSKDLFNKPEIRVYMMMGISGSGKSTKVDDLVADEEEGTTVVVSRDIARVALGYCSGSEKYLGTTEQEAMVTAYCNELIRESAEKGKHIIIDDMNLKRKYRDAVKELLKHYNVKYIYVYVEADSIEKNIERRKGQISPDIIKGMVSSIEWPSVDEYDIMFISQN